MNNPEDQKRGVLADIGDNLGAIFRHLLPGVLAIGVARVTHPSWFVNVQPQWPSLVVIGVIAIAVGNAWFAINRYGVHQIVDFACWLVRSQGPARESGVGYLDSLAEYVKGALSNSDVPSRARQHIAFRASSVLLMYTLSELSFLAALWSEPCAITAGFVPELFFSSALLFVLAIWQNIITRRIDAAIFLGRHSTSNGR